MRNHDGVTPIGRRRIQQFSNQLSLRFSFRSRNFIEGREILQWCPFTKGKLPGVDASAVRAGQHRADRNSQALECRTDASGFLPSPFVEISLVRATPIAMDALFRNKAVS